MNMNGYQQYKEQSVMTMTRGELLVLLYDELIKRLKRADLAVKAEQFDVFDQSVTRCQEIVRYLNDTLDHSYPISQELTRHYEFFSFELSKLKAGRRVEIVAELIPLVSELRDAFIQAGKSS